MKKLIITTILCLSALFSAKGQTVFTCEYRTEADVKVYVTNYRNEADLVVGQGENPVFRITKKYVPLNR